MEELIKALSVDFEGYEVLRQQLLHLPKYGNDKKEVDAILKNCKGKDATVEKITNRKQQAGDKHKEQLVTHFCGSLGNRRSSNTRREKEILDLTIDKTA